MIETWDQWSSFIADSMEDDLLLYIVPLHEDMHSAINSPCVLFIKNLSKNRIYFYSFNHPDAKTPIPVDHKRVVEDLNTVRGVKWAIDKKSFLHLLRVNNVYDVGFAEYLRSNDVFETKEFETNAHGLIRRTFGGKIGFNRVVPLLKHLEMFSDLSETCEKIIKTAVVDDAFRKFNALIIDTLAEVETHGMAVDVKELRTRFGNVHVHDEKVYTQYYFYTSTGRPSNRYGGINYAALNKSDGARKVFISRFGKNGKLVLIDYSAFHPHIISYLTNYPIPGNVDIYEYLAKLYFNKREVDSTDISDAKQITFRQLFGGVEEKYRHIKYLSHLKEFIDYHWKFFNVNGYVETPIFGRKITKKHIHDPKPATVFNYILQAAEGEISIPVLGNVNRYLKDKETKAVLYTYDSILLDCCLDDGAIIRSIREIMGLDGMFPMKIYVGDNYHDMDLLI